jgi:Aspartyl protease
MRFTRSLPLLAALEARVAEVALPLHRADHIFGIFERIWRILLCSLIIAPGYLFGEMRMQVRDGHPIVDGVYVNGHGPYRFLVDTGADVNLIETNLARSIGLSTTFRTQLASSSGVTVVPAADGIEVLLGSVKAERQEFLFCRLEAFRDRWPDIQGLLGQGFLARFDYRFDLRGKRLAFGKQDPSGTRARFRMISGRPAVSTSLGDLVLDSGAERLVLFGVEPNVSRGDRSEMRTVAGSLQVGMVFSKTLTIGGRKIWRGDAVAIPNRDETGVDGLLPVRLFNVIYVCNSEGYVVFE